MLIKKSNYQKYVSRANHEPLKMYNANLKVNRFDQTYNVKIRLLYT